MRDPVYLDHNATTPLAPEVAAAMRPDTALVSIMHANYFAVAREPAL